MKTKYLIASIFLCLLGVIPLILLFEYRDSVAMLNPKGSIAQKELALMNLATWLMSIVVIPVLILTFLISWKYRASNKSAKYTPDWDYSFLAESVWWGFPLIIIAILSVSTWNSSHELDPYKAIETDKKGMRIQVVALDWKWLFIYPDHQIATINFFQFPENTPLNFELTSDAPMNSFWIPQLGGQIYAMPGMRTKLHLIAEEKGIYRGSSANLSGIGFAGMVFNAKSSSEEEFNQWVKEVKKSSKSLGLNEYKELSEPSEYLPPAYFTLEDTHLFDWIVMRPMHESQKELESLNKNKLPL